MDLSRSHQYPDHLRVRTTSFPTPLLPSVVGTGVPKRKDSWRNRSLGSCRSLYPPSLSSTSTLLRYSVLRQGRHSHTHSLSHTHTHTRTHKPQTVGVRVSCHGPYISLERIKPTCHSPTLIYLDHYIFVPSSTSPRLRGSPPTPGLASDSPVLSSGGPNLVSCRAPVNVHSSSPPSPTYRLTS